MSDISISAKNKLDENLLRNARYQSAVQTYTAYGVAQVNTNLNQLQQSTENQTNILNQQLQAQRNIASIQKSTNEISKLQLDEQKKMTLLKEVEIKMETAVIERDSLRNKLEDEEKKHIKLQQNLAFEAYRALKSLASSKFTNLENAFFYRQSMRLIETIDYSGLELQDKKFLLDLTDDMKEIGKKIEKKLIKKDITGIDKIEEIMDEDENNKLYKIENNANSLKKATEYMHHLSEIKDAFESAIPTYNKNKETDKGISEDNFLLDYVISDLSDLADEVEYCEFLKSELETIEKYINVFNENINKIINEEFSDGERLINDLI